MNEVGSSATQGDDTVASRRVKLIRDITGHTQLWKDYMKRLGEFADEIIIGGSPVKGTDNYRTVLYLDGVILMKLNVLHTSVDSATKYGREYVKRLRKGEIQ